MWYVYREYENGEAIEEAYDTLREARRAELFLKDYFSPIHISVAPIHKISVNGGSRMVGPAKREKPSLVTTMKNALRRVRLG